MFKPRRFLATMALAVLLGLLTAGLVRAVNPPEGPPAGASPVAKAKIENPPGSPMEAEIHFPTVTIQTTYGTFELRTQSLKEISIDSLEAGVARVTVTIEDQTRFHGKLQTTELPVSVGGQTRNLELKDGLHIKFLRPNEFGVFGAVIGLLTLTLMEIVLGIDNIIFLAILSGKLPAPQQPRARRIGLIAALGTRLGLLFCLTWLLGLTKAVFTLPEMPLFHNAEARGISWRDLILMAGGAFLIGKSTLEMHEKVDKAHDDASKAPAKTPGFWSVILQIAIMDIIFSLDSVITAVGMVDELWIMVVAMLIAVGVMMIFAGRISRFVENHPTIKILALSFLILIGVLLIAESLGQHIDKGYIYFAMAFAMIIELINMRMRKAAD
jgi:predicted tellurium resistance membrane protein TerC